MELRKYWEVIIKRWRILLATTGITTALVLAIIFFVNPVYQSKAKMWVRMGTVQQKFIKGLDSSLGSYT
jgi:capsular polysaccharide biosynthesis protein